MSASVRASYVAFDRTMNNWQALLVGRRCGLSMADRARFGVVPGWNCRDLKFFIGRFGFDQPDPARAAELSAPKVHAEFRLAMDLPPCDHSASSSVDGQAQKIPVPCFSGNNPIASAQVGISYSTDAVSSSDAYRFAMIDATGSTIDADAVTIDCHALRKSCRDCRVGKVAKTKNCDNNYKETDLDHNGLFTHCFQCADV